MKKKIIPYFLLISIIYLGIGFMNFSSVEAEEIGQVQTSAGVGFYEDSTDSSSTQQKTTSQSETSTKPKGRLPSTGELVKASIALSGIILILFVVLVILWKRKKNKQSGNGKRG